MAVRTPWKSTPRRSPEDLEREEDGSLAQLASEGNEEAFAAIFERHHRGLLTLSRHMLGSREEAEDALQHTFAAAYRQLAENGPPEHLRAWLYATARNRCSSLLRARRELPHGDVPGETAWLPDEVENRSDLRELLEDIQKLPEDQRIALVLAEIEDLDHAEIAEVLGCRRDKVRALVFQARSTLGGWREARATPCREVREEIAIARGPDLRRAYLRRHLAICPDCTAFRENIDQQRRRVALLLPPIPIALALKEGLIETAIAGTGGAVGGAAVAAGGGAAAGGAGGAGAGGAGAGGAGAGAAAGGAGGGAAGGAGAAAGGAAAAGGGIATAVKVGAAALVIGGAGVAGFAGLGGGGDKSSSNDAKEPNPAPAVEEPQAADPATEPSASAGSSKKKTKGNKAKAEKRLKANERNQGAGAGESVAESTPPAPVSQAGTTSQPAPTVPATPSLPATPKPPPTPPVPQAPLEAAPEVPSVDTEGEIRAAPPVDPQEVLP
ncbi:MAG TPA: sigma-70 family RNA polymerase sigma factor [Thermoleophilaceae bacterium]|nr:sigma-70 family RNA polymerase sigma factor [Thermoleophilaceae bacterium]